MMDMATQLQIETNERDAKTADLEYSRRVREMMFGDGTPENPGFYGLSGQNAVDAFGDTQASLASIRDEVASTIKSERARQMFTDASNVRMDQEIQRATVHSFKAGKDANEDASSARVNEFRDDAVARFNDPKAIAQNKQAGVAEVVNFWQDQGALDETVATKVGEFTTEFHSSIVKRHLAGGDYLGAQAYFDDNIAEIDGRSHPSILEDIARETTSSTAGLKRDMREHITALNMGTQAQGLFELQAMVDATPVGMNDAFDNLRQDLLDAIADQPIVAAQMKLPPGEVGDFLATFRARMSSTDPAIRPSIDELRQFEKIKKAHAAQAKMFADGDGLAVAAQNGLIDPLQPLNFNDPASIAARVQAADTASDIYQMDIPPFLDGEVDGLIDVITGEGAAEPPSVDEVVVVLNNVQQGLGEDGAAFMVRDIINKDQPAIALALQTVQERPGLAADMIKGQRFLNENKEFAPKFTDKQAGAAAAMGNLFTKDTLAARGDIMAAADGLYALRAAEAGETAFNATLYKEAIKDVIGGTVDHNGRTIVPPFPDMEQDDFDAVMAEVANTTLMDENGELPKFMNGEDFTADMLTSSIWRDEAQLVSTSMDGTYNLLIPGVGYVLNGDQSAPYELNLRDVIDGQAGLDAPLFSGLDLPPEIALGVFEERQTVRGLITELGAAVQGIPEPPVEEGSGGGAPQRRPGSLDRSMSVSKGFTASAEVEGLDKIPTKRYKDSRNIPTIGIGFNLVKPGAREMIEDLGYDYAAVLSGKQEITQGDAFTLYQRDYATAQEDARAVVPDFDNLDFARKTVLTDMAFNMGREGLSDFDRMLTAIAAGDWDLAADEAQNSAWFKQVGRRGPRNVEVLRTGEIK
jgi:GH24 family phage-related lysozyme (muramidase)